MGDQAATSVAGVTARGYQRGSGSGNWDQYVIPVRDRIVSARCRAGTFVTPGRAGTTGQKIMSIFNATGSSVIVDLLGVTVDKYETVVKAVTVPPPIVRLHKVTTLHTNGSSLTKVPVDSGQSSSSSVTVLGDASADGTGSGTTLTSTLGSIMTQEMAPRLITAVGYEIADRMEFLGLGGPVTLRALEGITVNLYYTLATQNPVTDMWIASMTWEEYTRP